MHKVWMCSLLVGGAAAAAASAAPQPQASPSPKPAPVAIQARPAEAPPRHVVPLVQLVKDALQVNLGLRSARASTRGVESSIQAAEGVFDPVLSASPSYGTSGRDLLTQTGVVAGSEGSRGLAAGVQGSTRLSTTYGLSLDHSRSDLDDVFVDPNLGPLQPQADTALTFNLRQPLLRGFGPFYAGAPVRIAELSTDSSRQRLDRTAELTVADVETAYWNLGLAEAFEIVARESYQRALDLMGRNQQMSDLKLIAEVDLITSRRGVQQRLTALTEATLRRQDAADRLWFLVYGERAKDDIARVETLGTEPPPSAAPPVPAAEAIEAQALEARGDVRSARADLDQAGIVRRVAKNSLLPDVAVNTSYSTRANGTEGFGLRSRNRIGDLTSDDWRVFASFNYPLWNRSARAAHARAQWDHEVQALNVAATETAVRSELRASTRAVRTQVQRLDQSRQAYDLARQQYDAGQQQLQLGLIDSFRLLQLEEDVANSALTYQQVRYDLAQAITSYQLATGGLLEKYDATAAARPDAR